MFSSKFLSGANPLNAVSSAVNKFGLFGDDGEGDKSQKLPSQQPAKPPAEQQPGGGQSKGPQQQQGSQKSGQSPSMQKNRFPPKQGSPQLGEKGQAGPPSKPGGQAAPKSRAEPEGQLKGEQQKQQPPSSPKPGAQQHTLTKSGTQPDSPKATSQQVAPKTGMQKPNPVKAGAHQDSAKSGPQQAPSKMGPGSPRSGQQPQGSAKPPQQQQGTTKMGQQPGSRTTLQHGPQLQGSTRPVPTGAAKAGSLCPVCKTTELNVNTKESPNHKICTECKKEVCSLCGFSPPDSDGREWLCLNCQLQRAQKTSEPQGASMKKTTPNKGSAAQNQPPPASPIKRETSTPQSPQKILSTSSKAPAQGEVAKVPESHKQLIPAATQKVPPKGERGEGPQKTDQPNQNATKQSSGTTAQKESGGIFGPDAAKAEATKTEESVTGKMFGFGSSIFSSASTLIASAVQDNPKTTPPVSPKIAPAKESKSSVVPKSEQDKKQAEPTQARAPPAGQVKITNGPSQTQKDAAASHSVSKAGPSACPLCTTVLNVGSKDPPNYNICTECKSTVCNQCGFNPMPNVKEGKEWLCLNCQVKRATSGSDSNPLANSSIKRPLAQPSQPNTSTTGSPQKKTSTPAAQPSKVEALGQKSPSVMESRKTSLQSQPGQTNQTAQKQENASAPAQQQAGGLFGFGSSKIQTSPAKPTASVTGKMFGLGSTIFSSASTLISPSSQDEPKTTPPVSPKMSGPKDTKTAAAKKPVQEKKSDQQHLLTDEKTQKPHLEQLGEVSEKRKQSFCPLCKLELNIASKGPPNFSTCTLCKNMVCNQCGFNPMPNITEVKEWLCLNCQMQRALGSSEPPGTPAAKLQASPNRVSTPASTPKKELSQLDQSRKKNIPTGAESKVSQSPAPGAPQKKQTTEEKQSKTEPDNEPEGQKQIRPGPGSEMPEKTVQKPLEGKGQKPSEKTGQKPPEKTGQKLPEKTGQKLPDQTHQTELNKINSTSAAQEESKGFFGFGGSKPQQDTTKSAESLGGKMFGFGSSIFSSASTLISSAVQDEQNLHTTKETPPKASPLPQTKTGKTSIDLPKDAVSSIPPKVSTCPLCKVELNVGSKEPSNYKNCTECQKTVCVQCGFNPTPNMSEAKEWLCLNCQTQRALKASEITAHPSNFANTANKVSPSVAHPKTTPTVPGENINEEFLKSDVLGKADVSVALMQNKSSLKGSPQKVAKRPESDPRGPQKPADQASQPKAKEMKAPQESAKTTESVTGKMFGFGSSIFSSASTLISSAVQEESRTTPPSSRKMSAPPQVSPKLSAVPKITSPSVSPKMPPAESKTQKAETIKTRDLSEQKSAPSHTPTAASATKKADKTCCLLCKVELNIGSKDPANYNTCTECKTIVCTQCGFNPMPTAKVKEWLCLNCQMKRAVGALEPPGLPTKVPEKCQDSPGNDSALDPQKLNESTLNKDIPKDSFAPKERSESNTSPRIESVSSGKLDSKEKLETHPKKPPDQAGQPASKQSTPAAATGVSGGFFGFGSPKSQPDAAKPAVAEKMFGFGSSIFSSASALITSAVQDQPKTTPPASPNMSPAKGVRSPSIQKLEQQKKSEPAQQGETPSPELAKLNQVKPKAAVASEGTVKTSQSTCPLCKTGLNMGSKDVPNYSTCTECKNIVCNQCGFNPMPNETVKDWLCLTCQMQRTLNPPEANSVNAQIHVKSPKKEPLNPDKYDNKAPQLRQRTSAAGQPAKTEASNDPGGVKQPTSSQKMPQEPQKMQKKASLATQEESGGLFGFGGGQSQPDIEKSAESVTEKMFGFGSSIFGSASSLITSAVQDQPKTTLSISPKMSPAKEIKPNLVVENKDQKKTPQQTQQSKKTPLAESKLGKTSEPLKPGASEATSKTNPSSCPLCKIGLNVGTKNPPNYSTCTKCNTTVCNQCGFNPMPNVLENKEWLCLTCQMEKALIAAESTEPTVDTQASPNKVPPSRATTSQTKDTIPTQKSEKLDENHLGNVKSLPSTEGAILRAETTSGSIKAPTKEEMTDSPPTTEVPSVTKGTTAVKFDNKPPLAQPAVVDKDNKTSESPPDTKDIEKQEKAIIVQKSADQPETLVDKVKPKQTLTKDSNLLDSSRSESTLSVTQPTNQESGGFFSSSSPKPQPSPSKTAEAVTGKMLGFGSSLFGSASTLITSAVQESRTTPPNSRKMSAPAQVSNKASEIPSKSGASVSLKTDVKNETKLPTAQKPQTEKEQDKPLQAQVTNQSNRPEVAPEGGKSTCPLCKADLNLASKDPVNYNICTECKTIVCSKCGFSPMPSLKEGNEWLCLNCQMQRALGASEPPGFPMIKSPTLPHKELPASPQKKKSPTPPSQEDVLTPDLAKNNVPIAKESEDPSLSLVTKKVIPNVSLSDRASAPVLSKAYEKNLDKTLKGQPALPEQQATVAKPSPPTAPETAKMSPQKQQPAKPLAKEHPKAGTSPAKTTSSPAQPPKQDSVGFFGFGGPKSQPSIAQSAGSVTGKMFGFGSSFLSSASTLITSAVQDEPKTTPPTPRKMSAAGHVSPKTTPPASPRSLPVKDTKPFKTEEKTPVQLQQAPVTAQAEREKDPAEKAKAPTDKQDLSVCPLCKGRLNLGSKDPPNYNTCTQCKSTVCSQCGFDPKPNVIEVKEWLCLNCQIQRAQMESEPTGQPAVKPQPSPSKVVTRPASEKKDITTAAQKVVKKEVADKVETTSAKPETPQSVSTETKQIVSSTVPKQGQDVSDIKPLQVQPSQKPKAEIKVSKQEEAGQPPSQPAQATPPTAKPAPPPAAQAAKQGSGGFFGFGGLKAQPAKSSESVTGKMLGFGSSIFSSASTLITSTVQDEPKTTPPTPRKMSTPAQVPAKTTPPVSPAKKSEVVPHTKAASLEKVKEEKGPPEPPIVAGKDRPSTCPLCKVELNVGTKDLPNYSSCTECKITVCNLCGFNPTPHTGAEEWLCLNCQTQKVLSGQLGDSGKMSQPVLAIAVTKESAPTFGPVKATTKTISVKAVPTAPPLSESTSASSTANDSPNAALVSTAEITLTSGPPLKETAPKPQSAVPNIDVPTVGKAEKTDPDTAIQLENKGSEITAAATHSPVTDSDVVPLSSVAAKVALAGTVQSTGRQTELSTQDSITKATQSNDYIKKTQATKSSQQDEMQLTLQEPHPEAKAEIPAAEKDRSSKMTADVDIISSEGIAKSTVIKEQAEPKKESMTPRRLSLTAEQIDTEPAVNKPESKVEAPEETEPQILSVSHDVDEQIVSEKDEVKPLRRRLSFQAEDDSSESEVTPSPKVQRRKLEVANISSSSEDIKTESADSCVEDEDFIRQQIRGMGSEEQMSLSEDGKDKALISKQPNNEAEFDNPKLSKDEKTTELPKSEKEDVQQTTPSMYKKATPIMRQATDEDVDSITESPSKGSSSVQCSSFTPESSHTSASSLDEDSDSSPSHRIIGGDKQHRKGKYRQPKLPLPIIEDSSEDEKFKKENIDDLAGQTYGASSPSDLRQVVVVEETSRTSGSEYSASIDSEPQIRQAVQIGRKPSPTVIPYTPAETFVENTVTKVLKTAEETYEDIIQKTKAIPGESPDIEPLYGGMAIEDYLYESLVEGPEIKIGETKDDELQRDSTSESIKKLRSPEEVYEEMMQKKRELMMIEQEFQQAQTAMECSLSDSVAGPSAVTETCIVTMPTEEPPVIEKADVSPTSIGIPNVVPVKKKKRPAPPRPSEPPKRGEVSAITPGKATGFVRPMIPQDPALRKALFPIPDLKITQCSSGEEEDDSLADEYGVGVSSDITPSDDSETKEDAPVSPPFYETAEIEPISVVCEIPEPKPIPTPISAPELTTTPSPVSPASPTTSSPDSSLESNATSSPSFKVETPLSTPLSTPTPPTSFVTQSSSDISPLSPVTMAVHPGGLSYPTSSTVVVTIPDVVSNQATTQTTVTQAKASTEAAHSLENVFTHSPVVVQMPDLVSSPSQASLEPPAPIDVSAAGPLPVVISSQSAPLISTIPVKASSSASVHNVSPSVTLASGLGPVIVQMPDLVSTTSPICGQTPQAVSALVTQAQVLAQAKVVHSVPVQAVTPCTSPVLIPTVVQTPAPASTTVVKKKVPPPPPPRSTSVSASEPSAEQSLAKTDQHVSPTLTTTVPGQPMKSVIVDIQPRMEEMLVDNMAVASTRSGHVVIIVPSAEKISLHGQTPPTTFLTQNREVATQLESRIPSNDATLPSSKTSGEIVVSASSLSPKPIAETRIAQDASSSPPTITHKPPLYPKPQISKAVAVSLASATVVTTVSSYQPSKPPPPIPPKPTSIPAGLVFSHKPGESVNPPTVVPKAATLPRTKEPPNALSLSLTRHMDSKLGTTSPKSPLSPRYAKCLQTYVVITLPSELGSPPDAITVQAPVRRGSIPSTKASDIQISEQKAPCEVFSAQAPVRRASVPHTRHPPPNVAEEQLKTTEVPVVVPTEVQVNRDYVLSVIPTPPSIADDNILTLGQESYLQLHSVPAPIKKPYVQQQQPVTQPLPTTNAMPEVQPPLEQEQIQSIVLHPDFTTEVTARVSEVSPEVPIPQAQRPFFSAEPQPQTDTVTKPQQPEVFLEVLIPQENKEAAPSSVSYTQIDGKPGMLQTEQNKPSDAIVTEEVLRSQTPYGGQQVALKLQTTIQSFDNAYTIVDVPSRPQTVQPLDVLPPVAQHQFTQDSHSMTEVVTTTPFTEAFTTESAKMPEVTPLLTATHPLTLAAEFTPLHRVVTTADGASSYSVTETQQITGQQNKSNVTDIPQVANVLVSSALPQPTPQLDLMPLQIGPETPKETLTNNAETGSALSSLPSVQPQTVAGMPTGIITTEETTMRRRSSVTSTVHSPYVTNQLFDQAAGYEIPTQVANTEAFTSSRRESITIQHPLPAVHMVSMPAERDLHTDGQAVQAQYNAGSIPLTDQKPGVLSYSSEYAQPLEIITTEAYTRRTSVPTAQDIGKDTGVSLAPVTIAKFQQESIESQQIRGPEKVVSSMSHMYSSISTSGQPPESLPNLVTQVVTTEVQRTTVSVVHERLPQVPPPSIAINIQPDLAKVQPLPKQNGRIIFPGEVVDLRTMKTCVKMTEQGMDLTPPDSHRQAFLSDPTGRPITAVQPEIVNLSSEITPAPTLSVVTDSITIVTCTATISSHNNTPAEKPLDLQDPVTSLPLPLTTYKPFEPLAQIVYKPVNSQSIVHTVTAQDTPINLSFGVSPVSKSSSTQGTISNGRSIVSLEATGAIDLSNYRPVRAMVALSDKSSAVVASVVEDDGIPVDLTAGRRSVCCDVIYKLPFTGSCRTQPPVTTQPDGLTGSKGMTDVKASVSESNLMEPGLFLYDTKTDGDYLSGSSDGAMDLTAAHLSAGKALDYTSKSPGSYPGTTAAPHSQVPAAGFGVNSTLRTADGIVYSSVAAPVPSTYAITTQPGSIFSTTLTPMSLGQNEALSHLYGFIPSADPGQFIPFDPGLGKELLPTALADIISGYPDIYSDTTLEAIAASLDALSSSPIFPGLDNSKMAQYQMEREFLELEKLKQLCLAEELEWERQEIQRYREQEQFMVQREIEELQALKHQLLFQQEEEHHAHMVAQQETYAQQKEQLHQIQQLQLQLQRQLDEHYGSTGTTANLLDAKYAGVGDSGQYWPVKDEGTLPSVGPKFEESQEQLNIANKQQADQDIGKKIIDSGVQTDDEDSSGKHHVGQKRKNKKNIDSDTSGQTDDEDQDEWDAPSKARRRSRKHSGDGKHGSKVSSIAIQTVAEISVQTDHSGTIKKPNVQMDTKVEIIKHISAPENSQKGGSLSCQTESDRRHTPIDLDYSTHLTVDMPSKSKIFYSQVCPLSPEKSSQGMLRADPSKFSSGPRILKAGQKSLSDPKPLSPSTEDRMSGYYLDSYSGRGLPSGTGKKVKRTLPDPPPEDDSLTGRSGYSTNSARRRLARSTTMARAKILQDIDKELDLVERESSKLRKKQAELDEEEKEIDAKLRYLEMGINRRKEALLKEREKRERAYLQGVAEERDYMSDSEVSNIREARGEGLERPRTAPQSEFDQFIPPQTEADSQYNTLTSPYSPYAQYVPQTQTTSHFTQQNLYQQPSLYQVSPYPTLSLSHGQTQASSYQHALLLQQGKQHQSTLSDLEPKITSNYEVIRNQPLLIVSTSTDSGYGVPHLGGKYANVDLRLGLEERSMASSPMSSISADSFYADIDHHNARNYVLIEDIGELTKTPSALSSTGLGSGFSLPDKEMSKADRLLRATEARRTAEVADFLGSSRLQTFGKGEDDTMEDPYELKLLKQQIKQEFRRGTDGLDHLTGLGLPHYIPSDSSFRHFPKGEKYSIGRLTLEKQAAKQLPAAVLYQKQMKNKKALIDPKAITKFSPIQESRDLEPDFTSYMGTGASSVSNLAATARLLQDEITFGLRKNLAEQQKYLSSPLGGNLAGSLNLGQSLGLGSNLRATGQDDGTYPSGTRSRPSSRPSSRPTSVYGLDLSIKRDLSSSSLRLKTEGDVLEAAFAPGVARAKPTSLPISQSRGRIPIVAQNSEEESPLSPVGQPMGMARASAGPLPPISADTRDQFGSSHSLPEVQQHMREESRTLGYERDTAFIIDDLQGAMSDSEAGGPNWNIEAYHLRREDTDWFDKPREGHPRQTDRRQMKLVPYACPHTRLKLRKDPKDTRVSGNGLGIRVVGGKEIPGRQRECGAYIAKVFPGGVAEQTGKVVEGMQVLEWNGVPLTAKTYEEVQGIIGQPCAEVELCVRLDLNMLSDPEHPQALEHHVQLKAGGQRSPGVDPKQLAAELQKVSQQQTPSMVCSGLGSGSLGVLSALERSALLHSGTGSAASSGVPSPGQPASPAINKKQRSKPAELLKAPHPITGEIQLQINYDRNLGNLIVHVLQARNLASRDNDSYSDPFVKVYLLPGRGQVMVVQNASADNKRRTRYAQKTLNPEWNQTVIYKNIHLEQLKKKTLEVTVWDYDRSSSNDFLGEVLIDLSNTAQLDNVPRWLPLKEQSESIEHSRAHHAAQGPLGPGSGQGHGQGHSYMPGLGPGQAFGSGQAPGQSDGSHDSPKNSVIKSRSHGIFPDPAKDLQMMPLEKCHSSPGSSKSSSDGQLRSHGPSRSQSKSSVTQAHLEDAGIAIAAAEAAVQQSCLQPRTGHRLSDVSGSVMLSAPNLAGDAFGGLNEDDGEGTGVDSAIFQVPRIGKTIPNGTDKLHLGTPENEGGKTQVMGEIKVALKKEVKTEGDQLVLEILQCRNITYKFKSPDHLPDLYVKLYVVNIATQKRIIKKKTRVCRHDREPSFNETFRFPLNPTGHSIQLFLVSNGGKFMKKTLIGEAYIWLDKVDMRKRVVSWHKLFVSSTQTNP